MFIKNGLRYNINLPNIIDGVMYGATQLLAFPEVMAKEGITEIPDPVKPEGFSDDESIWNETNEAPYFAITARDPEAVERTKQAKINEKALRYLAETDWYVTRGAETGVIIPADILTARQAARDSIIKLEMPL